MKILASLRLRGGEKCLRGTPAVRGLLGFSLSRTLSPTVCAVSTVAMNLWSNSRSLVLDCMPLAFGAEHQQGADLAGECDTRRWPEVPPRFWPKKWLFGDLGPAWTGRSRIGGTGRRTSVLGGRAPSTAGRARPRWCCASSTTRISYLFIFQLQAGWLDDYVMSD